MYTVLLDVREEKSMLYLHQSRLPEGGGDALLDNDLVIVNFPFQLYR
jgi:hypothetical protein